MSIPFLFRLLTYLAGSIGLLVFNQCSNHSQSEHSASFLLMGERQEIPSDLPQLWQKQYLDPRYTQKVGLVEVQELGLWVADALVPDLAEFFPAHLPAGTFPLVIHLNPHQHGYDIEGASIKFSSIPVTRWERAQNKRGQYGVMTDTGLFTFLSTTNLSGWKQELPTQLTPSYVGSSLEEALTNSLYQRYPTDWCSLKSITNPLTNFPITGTGIGDGYFSAYWGMKGDEVVAFVLQFAPSTPSDKMVMAHQD